VPFPQVAAALEKGGSEGIDGAILTEPFATQAVDKGIAVRLSEDFINGFTPTYLYFNKAWSTANPEVARKFVKAYVKGARDLQGDKWYSDSVLATLEKFTKVPADVQKRASRAYFEPNGRVPVEDIMTLQKFLRSTGGLNYAQDIDMKKFVNTGYAEAAVKELGEAK
jgi:NitT/TauT family transport system substrate-binding protein